MAEPATQPHTPGQAPGDTVVAGDDAQGIADAYLIDYVGNLLEAGTPRLSEGGLWVMPVFLGNARRGRIGQVGTISVESWTGEVLFSEEDRARVKAGARLLAGPSSRRDDCL